MGLKDKIEALSLTDKLRLAELIENENTMGFKQKNENAKLLDFLQTSCNEYQENILPLVPELYPAEGNDYVEFDAAKNEFLESVWDAIYRHFTGEINGGFLPGPDGV